MNAKNKDFNIHKSDAQLDDINKNKHKHNDCPVYLKFSLMIHEIIKYNLKCVINLYFKPESHYYNLLFFNFEYDGNI